MELARMYRRFDFQGPVSSRQDMTDATWGDASEARTLGDLRGRRRVAGADADVLTVRCIADVHQA